MWNLSKKVIINGAVLSLALSAGVATTTHAEVTRLGGLDRYSTSDAIVKSGWPKGATSAVLASSLDANEVDALTVAPLAKDKNAPVILVNPKDSIDSIVSKFTALNVNTVYIANGTGVISSKVDDALKNKGITTVKRLGGANRYETALNIAKELGASNAIVVASGNDAHLIDSLSIASIAAAKRMPIFLLDTSFDASTTAYINNLGAKTTYVLGGTAAVSDDAVKTLPAINRLGGSGRYETNVKVVDTFRKDASLNLNNIFIASGEDANLIDSLAGAPLAGSIGAPIVLVHDTINPDVNILLTSVVNGTTKIIELGGVGAVTSAADDAINKIQTNAINFSNGFIINYSWNNGTVSPEYSYRGTIKIDSNLNCEINYCTSPKTVNKKFSISEDQKNTLYKLMVDNQFDTKQWTPVDINKIPVGGGTNSLSGILNGKNFSIPSYLNAEDSKIVSPVYKYIDDLVKANLNN